MAEISKLVRQRLAKQAVAAEMQAHPDADLLTGFLEQSLSSTERHQILQHLVFCAECRDVVTSALPQEVELQNVSQPVLMPARPAAGWRNLVLVRWGSVAAALIIGVGAVTMYRAQNAGQPNNTVAERRDVAPAVRPPVTTHAASSETSSAAAKKPEEAAAKDTVAVVKQQPATVASRSASESNELKSNEASNQAKMKSTLAKKSEIAQPAVSPAARPAISDDRALARSRIDAGSAGVVGGVAAGIANKPAEAERAAEAVEVAAASPPAPGGFTPGIAPLSRNRILPNKGTTGATTASASNVEPNSATMVMADTRTSEDASTPIVTARTARPQHRSFTISGLTLMPKGEAMLGGSPRAAAPDAPTSNHWKVSELGRVEHSADGGANWTPVNIGDGATFRSVAHSGNQVWAGGDGGVLYHSSNDGATWTHVTVATLDRALKGDIISIEVSASQRVRVLTSTDETWTTVDRGLHWDVQ